MCYDLAHQIRCTKHTFSGRCDITPMVCCLFGGHSTPQFLQCSASQMESPSATQMESPSVAQMELPSIAQMESPSISQMELPNAAQVEVCDSF